VIIWGICFVLLAVLGVVPALLPGRLRILRCILGSAALLPLVWSAQRDWACTRAYERATIGARRADLVAALGHPTKVTLRSSHPDAPGISAQVGRAECLWYHAFFAIESYELCFSADARLVHKYDWISW
jgi:hypothetical protein